jgi:hypothetical protein
LYFLENARHAASDFDASHARIVSSLGARFGNHTSYQFPVEKAALGTPRGGRLTVPIRNPSPR